MAVRWYCRYPLSYRDLLAERGITVDAATVYRRVRKPDILIAPRRGRVHSRGVAGRHWPLPL